MSAAPDAAELARRFRAPLVRFARAYLGPAEAEDAAQEVLAHALTSREALAEPRAWLYRALRNHCLNVLRARAHHPDPLASAYEPAAEATRLLSRLVRAEERADLAQWLARLPAPEREALLLRYAEDLSRDEIARVLEVPPATVKTWLFAGLERLRGFAGGPQD
jgi:RNA polymerase sigma-70 factor (ECF subfamily)